MDIKERLVSAIEANTSAILDDLSTFVAIDSISDNQEKVKEALYFILGVGKKLGFHSYSCLNDQIGIIEICPSESYETLGILSHVDVVAPGDLARWNTDPFQAVIQDDKIYGRGTLDDKGAIIASLYAMKAVCDLGIPLEKNIRLILGTQEEVEWTDMEAYVKNFLLPDYGFTPDGEFPICNIEKGSMDILMEFPLDDDECLTKQKRSGKFLAEVKAGTATNIVPGVCFATVVKYQDGTLLNEEKIEVVGKSTHSCQPENGENALLIMAQHLEKLSLENNKLLSLVTFIKEYFKDIYGKELGLYSESEYYNGEFVHRNVFTPTMFSVNDHKVRITVNVRFAYGTDPHEILQTFQRLVKSQKGHIDKTTILPAVYVPKDRPFLKVFAHAYEEISPYKNQFVLAYGGSYAKAMPNIVSWGPIFPGEEDTCHEENEYISIVSLLNNAKIYALAISKIVFSKESFK